MESEIRIVIADDHPIFRKGLRGAIEADPTFQIVAEAESGETALRKIEDLRPDIAVLDIAMPNKDGFEVIQVIQDRRLSTLVIFLTMHKDERFFNAAMDRGARGYVLKDSASDEIVSSLKAVAAGEYFVSPQLSTFLVNRTTRARSLALQKPGLASLTPAENQVLRLIAANRTSREIANQLYISVRTVEKHRANISEKLGLHGSHSLLYFALEHRSELSQFLPPQKSERLRR